MLKTNHVQRADPHPAGVCFGFQVSPGVGTLHRCSLECFPVARRPTQRTDGQNQRKTTRGYGIPNPTRTNKDTRGVLVRGICRKGTCAGFAPQGDPPPPKVVKN